MSFPHGRTVYRLRAAPVWSKASQSYVHGNWDEPLVEVIRGAFVAQTSTSMLATATREQALESKSLYCDGGTDIVKGDRIFLGTFTPALPDGAATVPEGTVRAGVEYSIDGIPPDADVNPFTGWAAPREIPLTRSKG